MHTELCRQLTILQLITFIKENNLVSRSVRLGWCRVCILPSLLGISTLLLFSRYMTRMLSLHPGLSFLVFCLIFSLRPITFLIKNFTAKLADMYAALNSARSFAYAVARAVDGHAASVKNGSNNTLKKDHGYPTQRRDCAAAIMYTTEKSIEVAQECMQCLGGNG